MSQELYLFLVGGLTFVSLYYIYKLGSSQSEYTRFIILIPIVVLGLYFSCHRDKICFTTLFQHMIRLIFMYGGILLVLYYLSHGRVNVISSLSLTIFFWFIINFILIR